MNGHGNPCDARRVDSGKIGAGLQGKLVADLDLSPVMGQEGAVGHPDHVDSADLPEAFHDAVLHLGIRRGDGNIPNDAAFPGAGNVDGADVAAGPADGGCDFSQHARLVRDFQADQDPVPEFCGVRHWRGLPVV